MENFAEFEAGDYLDNEETIAEYLTAALEDENPALFLTAVDDDAKVHSLNVISGD
jgi:DNA-binding phage protein